MEGCSKYFSFKKNGGKSMVLEKLKAIFAKDNSEKEEILADNGITADKEILADDGVKSVKKMKVAILGAGCYRTHAASGITNFSRACEVAEATGKENISMTHSTIEMGAELLELAGVDEVVVSDPVFDGEFTVVDDFD